MFRGVSADWELRGSNKVAPYSRLLEMDMLKSGVDFELLISRCRSGERVVAVSVTVSCSCRALMLMLTFDVDIDKKSKRAVAGSAAARRLPFRQTRPQSRHLQAHQPRQPQLLLLRIVAT